MGSRRRSTGLRQIGGPTLCRRPNLANTIGNRRNLLGTREHPLSLPSGQIHSCRRKHNRTDAFDVDLFLLLAADTSVLGLACSLLPTFCSRGSCAPQTSVRIPTAFLRSFRIDW